MYVEVSRDYPLTYQINYYLMKTCNKCNEVKELKHFHKRSDAKDGCQATCKACSSAEKKQYYLDNRDHKLAYKRKYYAENTEKCIKTSTKSQCKLRKTSVSYKMACRLRSRLSQALAGKNKSASTLDLLGCSAEHARFHIESQFTEGMTWENTHIDHIQPCASFDLEDPNEQRRCFHYTNLQPLFAEDNLRKSDSIVPEHQVRLL